MINLNRRSVLVSASAAALGSVGVVSSSAAQAAHQDDQDIENIKNRLLLLEGRGKTLTLEQKYYVLLACVTAQALTDAAQEITFRALKAGVKPVLIKEAVYQCAPYVGIGRVQQVLPGVNKAMKKAGVKLPLPSQATVTDENRLEKGKEVQIGIFGDRIRNMHKNAGPETYELQVNDLSGFCFGDFYTRTGLGLKDRELVVFAAISTLGGCEAQLRGHIGGNLHEGNTKQNMIDALQVMVPYLGFPRTLNALAQIQAVCK